MPTTKSEKDHVAAALRETLISPNVADANLEPANVVDALGMIARGLHDVADAIREATASARESERKPR